MIKAVCFDFNGTLFIDHDLNHDAWKIIIDEISDKKIDFEDFFKEAKAYMNYQIVTKAYDLLNITPTQDKIDYYAHHKEEVYQDLCIKEHRNQTTYGAEQLLDYLKELNIPVILCTSSIKYNVDFYYKNLNLERWFDKSLTVYDTGEYKDKTAMYLECIRRLNADIKDTLIFEDSPKSIIEAIATGCPNIVAIKRNDTPSYPEIRQVIEDFSKLDYSIFN